jgi:uncharacterized membrane protein
MIRPKSYAAPAKDGRKSPVTGGTSMAATNAATVTETRWGLNRWVVLLLVAGWMLAVVATLFIDATLGRRFLDLPLSALVAGQGALFAIALVAVQVAAEPESED